MHNEFYNVQGESSDSKKISYWENIPSSASYLQNIDEHVVNHALELFQISDLPYTLENWPKFKVLVTVMSNELAATIYLARFRTFSDYSLPEESLYPSKVQECLDKLSSLMEYEKQICYFFDFFSEYRPLPPTQKYAKDVDVLDIVESEIITYCQTLIRSAKTKNDYISVKQCLNNFGKHGLSATFDLLKYRIASTIESEDLYSQRNYVQLMSEIKECFQKLKFQPQEYSELLINCDGYKDMMNEARIKLSMWEKSSSSQNCPDANDSPNELIP